MAGRLLCAVLLVAFTGSALGAGSPDPVKTLRMMIPVAESGFDPQASQDYYSNTVSSAIFETLYEWDYLPRPHRLVPRTAEAMPEISADGLTWTIRIRKGIHFARDPVFKGALRELTAQDYVYSWKRIVDPRMRSPNLFILRGKFVGLDDAVASAHGGKLDYDREVEGLRALDRYTLQLKLVEPDYTFLPYLGVTQLAAVAREVVEAHGDASGWVMAHPVGTGAYRLAEWRRGQKIVLEANPDYREEYFPSPPAGADAQTRSTAASMKGKRLPQIGRIEVSVIEEGIPALIAFNQRELDYLDVPRDLVRQVLDDADKLLPAYAARKVTLQRAPEANLASFALFNMNDPVVGGYTPEKIAFRRAILTAYDPGEFIKVALQGQGAPAAQPIPPEVEGHNPEAKSNVAYDPAVARALLDKFGYRDRDGDGFRETPEGKPLTLSMGTTPTSQDRIRDELWLKNLKAVGIRLDFVRQKWPDLLKMARAGQLQMWQVSWSAYSGDPYVQLAYGPSGGEANLSRFQNAQYDELYRQSRRTANIAERERLYRRMGDIVAAYAPMGGGVYRYENTLLQPWLRGYRKDVFRPQAWRFLDIDLAQRADAAR